jgi:serine/threonine protein kinase
VPLLHRDIKPQNLMLMENFRVKLADFGCSKLLARRTEQAGRRGSNGNMSLSFSNETFGTMASSNSTSTGNGSAGNLGMTMNLGSVIAFILNMFPSVITCTFPCHFHPLQLAFSRISIRYNLYVSIFLSVITFMTPMFPSVVTVATLIFSYFHQLQPALSHVSIRYNLYFSIFSSVITFISPMFSSAVTVVTLIFSYFHQL